MLKEKLPSTTSFNEKIDSLLKTGIQSSRPVAIWRIGGSSTTLAISQLSDIESDYSDIESVHAGFIVAPFDKNEAKTYIEADVMISSIDNHIKRSPSYSDSSRYDEFMSNIEYNTTQKSFNYTATFENKLVVEKDEQSYKALIQKTIDAIKSGAYQKIVPSRTKKVALKADFNPITEFDKLCKAYPDAFVSLVYIPNQGLWLGATPELLMSIDKDKIFRTVALAGTQGVPTDFEISKAAWTQKDIEEQALVSRYIINCFKKIRLREFAEHGPKTARAAHLIHLKTEFEVDMEAVNFPQLGSVMLDLLHPTSAVCGMPLEAATNFLKANENYNRGFYSGYLGPVNINKETNIYVNLRCMNIMKDHAMLFAGGGVTEDSEPESEWLETEMKFKTLLNVIEEI